MRLRDRLCLEQGHSAIVRAEFEFTSTWFHRSVLEGLRTFQSRTPLGRRANCGPGAFTPAGHIGSSLPWQGHLGSLQGVQASSLFLKHGGVASSTPISLKDSPIPPFLAISFRLHSPSCIYNRSFFLSRKQQQQKFSFLCAPLPHFLLL